MKMHFPVLDSALSSRDRGAMPAPTSDNPSSTVVRRLRGPRPTGSARTHVFAGIVVAVLVAGCAAPGTTIRPDAAPDVSSTSPASGPGARSSHDASALEFADLEKRYDARLGVFAVDTATGRTIAYRENERFAFASTYKALAAAAVLDTSSAKELDRVVTYDRSDLVTYSPITEKHLGHGMTVRSLCDAAVRFSDNTAGNLLLRELGGPAGFDRQLEHLGDHTTEASRTEPALNEASPGDARDTSTPAALAQDLRVYAVGNALPRDDRQQLVAWLRGGTTGDQLIRAGLPADWRVGDKSGAGGYGTRNDIAVAWPPGRAPVVLAVLSSRTKPDADYDNALVAAAAQESVAALFG